MSELIVTKLELGGKLDLSKSLVEAGEAPLTKVEIGLGWNVNSSSGGSSFDADSAVVLTNQDETTDLGNVCYFNQLKTANGLAVHSGDNRTGVGEGDDESITVDLASMPENLTKAIIYVSVFDAIAKRQNFGMLDGAYVRVSDKVSGKEICKVELDFDADTATDLRLGTLTNRNGSWFFSAEKKAIEGGIKAIIDTHVK